MPHLSLHIINHRGLNTTVANYFPESTQAAFADQLAQGFGIEFDPQLTQDGHLIICHDSSPARLSGQKEVRLIREMTCHEVIATPIGESRLVTFPELVTMIREADNGTLNALHIKASHQTPRFITTLLESLPPEDAHRFILFDLAPDVAQQIKRERPDLLLAPSVAHPHDISRYNTVVGNTLHSLDEALAHRHLYDWVWLDEWDRTDEHNNDKTLYNEETFQTLREAGYRIGLVTPELHATSPSLLGGESHPDAATHEKLLTRITEILALKPDAVCTDHTHIVHSLRR